MVLIPLVASALLATAVIILLDITPERIRADMLKLLSTQKSLKKKVEIARTGGGRNKIAAELKRINDALAATGKGGQFATICGVSVSLFVSGIVFAMAIENIFLVPILAISLSVLPFLYAKKTIAYYDKHIEDELETALSVITTSYIRSDDLIKAVDENIDNIKPPIRGIFKKFLGEAVAVNANLAELLGKLKGKVDEPVFVEWCDALIQCQDDRTIKHTLIPIIKKLSDIRLVNSELRTILFEPKKEYWMMVTMIVCNIPLLYLLNKSWYRTLMHTTPGQIVLAITGLVVFITALLMIKHTKPIKFRR